jgi:coenzyme F420-reducing hydrogenase delta subunit
MNVMFSDESTCRIVYSKNVRVRRSKTKDQYKSKFTISVILSEGVDGVMVWSCYSGKVARGSLYGDR